MIIKLEDIKKHFGGNFAVDGVSLEVEEHKITSIIGPNGSGKSTLFNVVSGFLKQDNGTTYLQDTNISELEDYEVARMGIQRTFQEIRTFPYLSIREHFDIASNEENENLLKNFFLPVRNSSHAKYIEARKNNDALYQSVLDQLGLKISLDTMGSDLSYGQGKLMNIAMGLLKKHHILLLDEPVAGVNPMLRKQIQDILLKLKNEQETILLIEHDINFVVSVSDWIVVMDSGKIITQGSVDEIINNQEILSVYLGR